MNPKEHEQPSAPAEPKKPGGINEDWLAVLLAFFLILLSALGVLGGNGLKLTF